MIFGADKNKAIMRIRSGFQRKPLIFQRDPRPSNRCAVSATVSPARTGFSNLPRSLCRGKLSHEFKSRAALFTWRFASAGKRDQIRRLSPSDFALCIAEAKAFTVRPSPHRARPRTAASSTDGCCPAEHSPVSFADKMFTAWEILIILALAVVQVNNSRVCVNNGRHRPRWSDAWRA